ncbi:MAG: ABC transporter ATP-binding protein [Thaumarchaeota archaeon]|nr:MAG: ABC transporter ATP-binding protein [Nitrososphaerota archaeon]RLG05195.1 MAG: ABC transporter ATP-binding protein [Nitrososphaerota archaeon]HDD42557.1 ABC transporter ATP-binding protein [Nitrososphaeria archaeon]
MANTILRIRDLVKTFGGLRAVDRVSMDVRERTLTILIGPNGSGKTTLINLVTGVYQPDGGRILFNGKDITTYPPHEIFRLGVARTFQIPQPFRKLTVLENLLVSYPDNPGEGFLTALRRGKWMKVEEEAVEKAFKIMKLLNLEHLWDQEAGKLSGGQMKLLEIGKVLMSGARLLVMDEPVAGVNPVLAHEIFRKLTELRDQLGLTIFLVEHRLEIALQYTDEVYVMASGKIISRGKPEQVMMDPRVIEAYLGG